MPDAYVEIPTVDMDAGTVVVEAVMLQLIENQRVIKAQTDGFAGKQSYNILYTWAAHSAMQVGSVVFDTPDTQVNQPSGSAHNILNSGLIDLSTLTFGDRVKITLEASASDDTGSSSVTAPDCTLTLTGSKAPVLLVYERTGGSSSETSTEDGIITIDDESQLNPLTMDLSGFSVDLLPPFSDLYAVLTPISLKIEVNVG